MMISALRGGDDYEISGRVALITGAARGIGFETARALHLRGASVCLVDLDPAAAAEAAERIGGGAGGDPSRLLGLGADVTDREAIGAAVKATVERFGGLDICVANAGIAPRGTTVKAMDPDVFERVLAVDLQGVYRTVSVALPEVTARQGQVLVISSIYAFTNGMLVSPYACAKAGVEQLGRLLRVELAGYGASASVAYFGFVDTEMVRHGFERDEVAGELQRQVPKFLRDKITPAEAAAAILDGLATRKARIIAPRSWVPLSVLRGVVNPVIDWHMRRNRKIQRLIRETEEAAGRPGDVMTPVAKGRGTP